MNTLEYSFLIKEPMLHKKIAGMQKTKTILFWLTLPLCFIPILGIVVPKLEGSILLSVLSMLVLIGLLTEAVYHLYFFSFLDKSRKEQTLSAQDETDVPFIKLNDAYTVHFAAVKKLVFKCAVVAGAGFLLFLGLLIAGAVVELDALMLWSIAGFAVFFIAVIVGALAVVFKQMGFAKNSASEIEQIRQYFYRQEGLTEEQITKKKRNIFTNAYDSQKTLSYLYPDERIRKQVLRLAFTLILPLTLIGGIMGGLSVFAVEQENATMFYSILSAFGAAIVLFTTIYIMMFLKLVKQQRAIFEADKEAYKYHLELADETKKYQIKSNCIMLVVAAVVIAVGVILGIVATETLLEISGLIFLCLIAWLVLALIIFIPLYRQYRAKVKPIEHKIDQQNQQNPESVVTK